MELPRSLRTGRAVYAYFNNDLDAVATRNALSLKPHLKHRLHAAA